MENDLHLLKGSGRSMSFLILVLIYAFFILPGVKGQSTVYIDPTFSGSPKSGTQTNPYIDFPTIVANTTYLLKAGTTLTTANSYSATANNVKISTYGTGRAYVKSSYTGNIFYLDGNGNTFENLDVTSTTTSQTGASVLNLRIEGGTCTINNCVTSGGLQGVAINNYYGGTGSAHVTNCTMHNTQRDGNYIDDLDSLIFKGNNVYDVNRNVLLDIGGDCLQTETVKYVVIDNCTLDHSAAGGKFPLINNGYIRVWVSNTTIKGADNSAVGGANAACIYPGGGTNGNMFYYVTNCKLIGAVRSIQNRADLLELKNVIMQGNSATTVGIDAATSMNIYNCDFINLPIAIGSGSWPGTRVIKNCIFYNVPDANYVQIDNTTGSNNISNNTVSAAQKAFIGTDVIASTDPLFVNPSGSDFRLQSASPCINHGADVGLTYDVVNTPRPFGAVDKGAYEFVGGTDTQSPSAPSNLVSSSITTTGFNLSWTASTDNVGVAGYNVYKNGVFAVSSGSTSASVTGLAPNTTYSITVKGVDASGNASAASNALNVTTSTDTQAPSVPTALVSNNIMGTSFTLSWTASTDNVAVTGYDVYKNGVLATSVSTTSASITGLSLSTTYSMTVKAKDGANNASAASTALNVTTSNQVMISLNGTGTIWQNLSTSTDNTGATASAVINDGNLSADVIFNDASGTGFYQGAGIVWTTTQSNITSVKFYNGTFDLGTGNGYFEANFKLQSSSDGITWTDVTGWTCSPAYPNSSAASNGIYAFSGSALGNVKGIRVVGQVHNSASTGAWAVFVKELQVTTTGTSDSQAPSVPTGLSSGSITNSSFTLSWTASTDNIGVTGYDVYKDGVLATSVSTTSASITGLTASTTYVMTVKAKDAAGNASSASTALNVTTTSTLPAPWLTTDVGAVGVTGSATYSNGTFTVAGSGTDIWDDIDQFRFVYEVLAGDGEIKARLVSQTNTNAWAKAGVMIRESLATGAKEAATVITPGNGVSFQRRLVTGSGTGYSIQVAGINAPNWVRIVRSGSVLSSYYSTNGTSWTLIGTDNVTMTTVYVGLCVSSHANTVTSTGVFDNVTVTGALKSGSIASATTSLDEVSVSVYPNPAADYVNIELSERSNVKIIDINGKVRLSKTIEAGKTDMQLNLESGLYILQVLGENNSVHTTKLMVN